MFVYILYLIFNTVVFTEPVLTVNMIEDETATTTDTVAVKYTDNSIQGVFDKYQFSLRGNADKRLEKMKSDDDKAFKFPDLVAGTEYTVEAKVFSGTVASTTIKTLPITTSKLMVTFIPMQNMGHIHS